MNCGQPPLNLLSTVQTVSLRSSEGVESH